MPNEASGIDLSHRPRAVWTSSLSVGEVVDRLGAVLATVGLAGSCAGT